jgi:ATP-dependent Lon protease
MTTSDEKFEIRKLPLMSIRDEVIFPYMMTPFVVGRESSVHALQEALAADKKIFLATQHDASIDEPKPNEIYQVGTVVNIVQSLKLPDGNIKVVVEGIERGKILQVTETEGFMQASVRLARHATETTPKIKTEMQLVRSLFKQYVNGNVKMVVEGIENWKVLRGCEMRGLMQWLVRLERHVTQSVPQFEAGEQAVISLFEQFVKLCQSLVIAAMPTEDDPAALTDTIASYLQLPIKQKQELLEILDPADRLSRIADVLDIEVKKLSTDQSRQKLDEMLRTKIAELNHLERYKEIMRDVHPEASLYEFFFEKLPAGTAIPTVDPRQLKHTYNVFRALTMMYIAAGRRAGSTAMGVIEFACSPDAVARYIALKAMLSKKAEALAPWQHGEELDEVVFKVAATIPLQFLQLDADTFLEQLRA